MSDRESETEVPEEDFNDFFDNALNGFAFVDGQGRILRVNARLAKWLGRSAGDLTGTKFSDHLAVAGKIYYETHLAPLLRMQGFFDEIALELAGANGVRMPVFANALERRDGAGAPRFVLITIFKAADRRKYERSLVEARAAAVTANQTLLETAALREQFMAVLGHDLRNPLASIDAGMRLLERTPLNDRALSVTEMVHKSVARMAGLVDNMMDFAQARLGGGIGVERRDVLLEPFLRHVVQELQVGAPDRRIDADIALPDPINCDPNRVAQLLSNLLANALTHGASDGAVKVRAKFDGDALEMSVANSGAPIPAQALEHLFLPFTRENISPGTQGLGLGLYIAAEVAKAHGGTLVAASSPEETRFTFRMPRHAA